MSFDSGEQLYMRNGLKRVLATAILLMSVVVPLTAHASPREQAFTIFNRLNGVPPTAETWTKMTALIEAGDFRAAALVAIDQANGAFYNVFLKDLILPWSNETEDPRVPFNDYTATVIGMVRDEVPFNQVLYSDIVYVGISPDPSNPLPAYSIAGPSGNDHYVEIESRNLPLHKILVRKQQSKLTYLTEDVAAGIFTTRGFAEGYYDAGTNRVAIDFAFNTFLCHSMEKLTDNTRPDFRVRRDVTRTPAGDPAVYKNRCSGCHAGMDGHAGAFAYMDWTPERGLIYNALDPKTVTNHKYNRNAVEFPAGYVTTDDSWLNQWASEGPNAALGWNGAQKGNGVKQWGKMLSQVDEFPKCMAQRALIAVCDVNPEDPNVIMAINQLANSFKAKDRYNMKHLFAQAAVMCRGK